MIRPYQYRPVWFYAMAYAGSWLPWFLGLYLGSEPEFARYAPLLNFIGLFGPIGASSVLVLTYQRPGAKAAIVHDGRSTPIPWSPYIGAAAW